MTRGSRVNPRVGRWTLFTSKKATFFTTVLRYCPWTHLHISVIRKPMTLVANVSTLGFLIMDRSRINDQGGKNINKLLEIGIDRALINDQLFNKSFSLIK